MSQQINLFSPVFKAKPVRFGLAWLLLLLLGIVLLSLPAWLYGRHQLQAAELRLGRLEASRVWLGREMETLIRAGDISPMPHPQPVAPAPAAALQQGRDRLRALQDSRHAPAFSAYFDGLARAQADGVWLTQFSVQHGKFSLQGRAQSAAQLPAYLDALDRQAVFAGSQFHGLAIQRQDGQGGEGVRFELQHQAAAVTGEGAMMRDLRRWLRRWTLRYDAQPLRQRLLATAVVMMVLLLGLDLMLLRPLASRRQQVLLQTQESRKGLDGLSAQLGRYILPRKSRAQAVREVAEKPWWTLRQDLVPPERMAGLLRDLVSSSAGLQLEQLETLPAEALVPDGTSLQKLWQHRQRLVLRGDYFALRHYLQRLEGGPWHLYWETLNLESDGHSPPRLTLQLSTLSEEAAWLAL